MKRLGKVCFGYTLATSTIRAYDAITNDSQTMVG